MTSELSADAFKPLMRNKPKPEIIMPQNARPLVPMVEIPADPAGVPLLNPTRLNIATALGALRAAGATSIGAGLQAADREMRAKADWWSDWAILLLTDGRENTAPMVAAVLPGLLEDIYPIAFGSRRDVTWALLRRMAARSGTMVQYVAVDPDAAGVQTLTNGDFPDLTGAYLSGLTAMQGHQMLYHSKRVAQANSVLDFPVQVDPCSEAVFYVSWLNEQEPLALTLQDPSGTVISGTSTSGIVFAESSTVNYYRVSTPADGVWTLRVTGSAQITSGGQPYGLYVWGGKAVGVPPTTMVVQPPTTPTVKGQALRLATTLNDSSPLTAQVQAIVQPPGAPSPVTVTLHDDGAHSDGAASDGLFANSYDATGATGVYGVRFEATGTDSRGKPFRRVAEGSHYVSEALDIKPIPPGSGILQPGSTVTYTVPYENATQDTLTGVSVDVEYDPGLEFVRATPAPSTGVDEWVVGTLGPGENGAIQITCRVNPGAVVGSDLTLTASIDSDQTASVGDFGPATVAGPPDSMVVFSYPQPVWVGSPAMVMVSIYDSANRLVGDGVEVTLTTDHGRFSQGTTHRVSTIGGSVEVVLYAAAPGRATVQVAAGSASGERVVRFIRPPYDAFLPLTSGD